MKTVILCFIAASIAQEAQSGAPTPPSCAPIADPRAVPGQGPPQPTLPPQEQYIEAAIPAPQYVYIRVPFPSLQYDATPIPASPPSGPVPEIVYVDEQPPSAPAPVQYGYSPARKISSAPPNSSPVPPSPAFAPVPASPPRTPIYLQYGSVPAPFQSGIPNSLAPVPPTARNIPFVSAPLPSPAPATQFIPSPLPRTPEIIYVDAPARPLPPRSIQNVPLPNPTPDPLSPSFTFRYIPGGSLPAPELVYNQEPCVSFPRKYDSTLLSALRPAPLPTYPVLEPALHQPSYPDNFEYIQQYAAPCSCKDF